MEKDRDRAIGSKGGERERWARGTTRNEDKFRNDDAAGEEDRETPV